MRLPRTVPPLVVFVAVCVVLATHYLFTIWLFDLCVVEAREALQQGKLRLERNAQGYAIEPAICPGLWDEVKNSRNRAVDILLAWASGGAAVAATVPVAKRIIKQKQDPKD